MRVILWYNAAINGQPVGESGILAAVAGAWDSPCAFVSGDAATVQEVRELLGPKVSTATVKWGLSRYSARNLTPVEARALIEEQAYRCVSVGDFPPAYRPNPPVTFRVELATVDQAAAFAGRTGVLLRGPRTVESTGDTFWQAWDQFWHR